MPSKKRETKKEMEQRIRNELKEEQNRENYYETKKRSSIAWTGIIGAIIGMVFLSFNNPDPNIFGIIFYGGVVGGFIGAAIGDYFG